MRHVLHPTEIDFGHNVCLANSRDTHTDGVLILDFPANSRAQRDWLRGISDAVGAGHRCYVLDRPDEVCIAQLLARGNPGTDTKEMFYAITKFFVAPQDDEEITVIHR